MNKIFQSDYIIIYSTVSNKEDALVLSRNLVSLKLAACCSIIPEATSVYKWEGEIKEESEFIIMIKTRLEKQDKVIEYINNNSKYEVPELISVNIRGASKHYLEWIDKCLKRS